MANWGCTETWNSGVGKLFSRQDGDSLAKSTRHKLMEEWKWLKTNSRLVHNSQPKKTKSPRIHPSQINPFLTCTIILIKITTTNFTTFTLSRSSRTPILLLIVFRRSGLTVNRSKAFDSPLSLLINKWAKVLLFISSVCSGEKMTRASMHKQLHIDLDRSQSVALRHAKYLKIIYLREIWTTDLQWRS